jgi:hypothetical protein
MATRPRLGQALPMSGRSWSRDGMTGTARGFAFLIMIIALSNDNVRPYQKFGWDADLYRDVDNDADRSR